MVCCIRHLAELRQVLQADDTADCDEEAEEESQDRADLAPAIPDSQREEFRDGEEEDDEVEEDVEGAVDVYRFLEREARPSVLAVPLCPEQADWPAFEGEVDNEGDAVAGQAGDYRPAGVGESVRHLFGEDAEVEQDDGDLRQDYHHLVDVLLDVEVLRWVERSVDGF